MTWAGLFLYHASRVVELACLDGSHDLSWGWPLLGIDDPGGRPRSGLAPVEAATLTAFHRDRQSLDAARSAVGQAGGRSAGEGGGRDSGGGSAGKGQGGGTQAAEAVAAGKLAAASGSGAKKE